ncbi:MAG TPA: rhomboid family intramembrane serine protease [Bryobacteraceae bacterium]|nr:rhomboid family intramembrane serine protease [Dongiaceae bacterium]HVP00491.1 rhomboid family intramembrane serine protease [Bryobacteraceae bacterium]
MILVPIGHENMAARRWPVITLSLIAINTLVFVLTIGSLNHGQRELGKVKAQILMLAALHPELKLHPEEQRLVDGFRQSHPDAWKAVQTPAAQPTAVQNRDREESEADSDQPEDQADEDHLPDTDRLQAQMDSLNEQYVKLASDSIVEQYAYTPAHPTALSYLTANFLHGSWMHLIGNMWFLWLAGFVLEDAWGRWLYSAFYLIAGAAALQFHAWLNPASIVPTLGASGAVAALMGAFLVRFPKMKIEMALVWWFSIIRMLRTGNPFRIWRFKASAYWLLPLWLAMEVLYGTLFGKVSSVAHWAHVGGFVFGAIAAVGIKYSGVEQKANKAIEEQIAWTNDSELEQAGAMMEQGQLAEAQSLLTGYVGKNPNSLDAWALLRQVYTRQSDTKSFLDATVRTCGLHLKAHQIEAAFQDYAEFLDQGGGKAPAGLWLELCKGAEEMQEYERALQEYQDLAKAYPSERQALTAQLSAARLCLKKLNRPQEALKIYQAASASPIPHLDWEQIIQSGIKEAKAAAGNAMAAGAQ